MFVISLGIMVVVITLVVTAMTAFAFWLMDSGDIRDAVIRSAAGNFIGASMGATIAYLGTVL